MVPLSVYTPWADIPYADTPTQAETPPSRHTPPDMVNECAVRMLLQFILVFKIFLYRLLDPG